MPGYRIYFRRDSDIIGRDAFEADGDVMATIVGETLWDACSDKADSFELWQGDEPICVRRKPFRPAVTAAEVNARLQALVIEREEAMQTSRWAIADSKRLLEQIEALKG